MLKLNIVPKLIPGGMNRRFHIQIQSELSFVPDFIRVIIYRGSLPLISGFPR
jgi:hypothetical protein